MISEKEVYLRGFNGSNELDLPYKMTGSNKTNVRAPQDSSPVVQRVKGEGQSSRSPGRKYAHKDSATAAIANSSSARHR